MLPWHLSTVNVPKSKNMELVTCIAMFFFLSLYCLFQACTESWKKQWMLSGQCVPVSLLVSVCVCVCGTCVYAPALLLTSPWVRMSAAISDTTLFSLQQSYTSAWWNLEFTPSMLCVYLFLRSFYLSFNQPGHPVCRLRLHARTEQRLYYQMSKYLATSLHFVGVCVCLSVSPPVLQAALLWSCLPARCSTWGLQAMRGNSWHGFEYMCFWKDKLSYVSNVSAPPRLQAVPHIWQIS